MLQGAPQRLVLAVVLCVVGIGMAFAQTDKVYVTRTGTKYHRESSRCQAITKKGTQCSRNAQAEGSYCWQHAR